MATYQDLFDLRANTLLRNRIDEACDVAADTIRAEDAATTNHTARLAWAKYVLSSPIEAANGMLRIILAANKALSISTILGATDAALQTQVDAAVNLFAQGM